MSKHGVLYLIPSTLGENAIQTISPQITTVINRLSYFIVEREKTARHFLKSAGYMHSLNELKLFSLNEHTNDNDIPSFIEPLLNGISMGVISEAGCPAVADPGANIVALAHQKNIQVVPLVGPSSILLALMASGFNGQGFTFHGYLPVKEQERKTALQQLEAVSLKTGYTQIFIEAPYRNNQLLKDVVSACKAETKLCIAVDITLPEEKIKTKPIKLWKGTLPDIHKKPAVFLLQA
jgi:16S rRNA (cytidine1402-2'-O)-methyltransferase